MRSALTFFRNVGLVVGMVALSALLVATLAYVRQSAHEVTITDVTLTPPTVLPPPRGY